MPDKLVPHNIEAEQAVLGGLLIDPVNAFLKVADILEKLSFYVVKHQWIYEAITTLNTGEDKVVDYVTLCDQLERMDRLSETGGAAYLTSLINSTPTALNIRHYAEIVDRTYRLRELISAAGEIAALAYRDDTAPLGDILNEAQEIMYRAMGVSGEGGAKSMQIIMGKLYDRVNYLYAHPEVEVGIKTGLIDLDKILQGMNNGDLILVGARPGMGKTILGLQIARNAAQYSHKTALYFSLEMDAQSLATRIVAGDSAIDSHRIRTGRLHEDEWPMFIQTSGTVAEVPLFIDDTAGVTVNHIRQEARKLMMKKGLDLIVIDYLQLMNSVGYVESRNQAVSMMSRALKLLARELGIPIILISQLSRECEKRRDKRPMLSDLRDSGAIEQDADIVMFVYRDEYYNKDKSEEPSIAEIIVAKHRNGPTGTAKALFRDAATRFDNLANYNDTIDF